MLTTPARAAPEWTNIGAPRSKENVCTTLTMAPEPASAIGPMKRLVTFQVPLRLRSTTARQPLSRDGAGQARELPAGVVHEDVDAARTGRRRRRAVRRPARGWRMLVGTARQLPPAGRRWTPPSRSRPRRGPAGDRHRRRRPSLATACASSSPSRCRRPYDRHGSPVEEPGGEDGAPPARGCHVTAAAGQPAKSQLSPFS